MSFFSSFPKEFYQFGTTQERAIMQNITAYVDVLDEVKQNSAFYLDYHIKEGERPDHVAHRFYGNAQLHWTFYLMNDSIRERGWPVDRSDVILKVQKDYSGHVLNTREDIIDKFQVGQIVQSPTGTGVVSHRNLDLGQVVLKYVSGYFEDGMLVNSNNNETLLVDSSGPEYLSARHYVNPENGRIVDINPFTGPTLNLVEVTHEDFYLAENESLRQIRVIRPDSIGQIVTAYKNAMRTL